MSVPGNYHVAFSCKIAVKKIGEPSLAVVSNELEITVLAKTIACLRYCGVGIVFNQCHQCGEYYRSSVCCNKQRRLSPKGGHRLSAMVEHSKRERLIRKTLRAIARAAGRGCETVLGLDHL